jgi:hypothetical protein
MLFTLIASVAFFNLSAQTDPALKIQYLFNKPSSDNTGVKDNISDQTATFKNSANVITMGSYNVLNLGNQNGYLDFGAAMGNVITTLDSFTISTCIYIETNTVISDNGNFIWTLQIQ